MNYRLCKDEEQLALCIWPGPYAFDYTAKELKQFFSFPFSDEGYDLAIEKLNEVYLSSDSWIL